MKNISKMKVVCPLIYFYFERNDGLSEGCSIYGFDFGHGLRLEVIQDRAVINSLLTNQRLLQVLSGNDIDLIRHASYIITSDYDIINNISNHDNLNSISSTREHLNLLKLSLGIVRRSMLIFQDFYISEDDTEPCNVYSLDKGGSRFPLSSYYPIETDCVFSRADLELARRIFSKLVGVSGVYSRFFNLCYYFELGRTKGDGDYRLRFTSYVSSLESIFNINGKNIAKSIVVGYYSLLNKEKTEYHEIHDDVHNIYKLRSAIVHGQKIPEKFYDIEFQEKLIGKLEYYVRELIIYIINNDLVDTVNSDDFKEYLQKLKSGT